MKGVSEETADRMVEAVTNGNWEGCNIKDMPWVKKESSGGTRSVDKMLKILDRRLKKNGKLREYRERQTFTKESKKRREARKEAEHKAQKAEERRMNRSV